MITWGTLTADSKTPSRAVGNSAISFALLLGLALALGAFLRVYMLREQILVDDEWHALNFVIGKSLLAVLTEFNPDDYSSPPLNLYSLLLYHTFGWSELALRLPALAAGLAALVVLPLSIRKILGERVALLLAFLLAISPFLIFYSRFFRAYSPVVLLAFCAVLLFERWWATRGWRYAAGFVVGGALASYLHPAALAAAFAPLGIALVWRASSSLSRARVRDPARVPTFVQLLGLAAVLAVAVAVLLAPALLAGSRLPWGRGHLSAGTMTTAATLVSGTANLPLNVVFFALCIAGQWLLLRRNPRLGLLFPGVVLASLVSLLVARPTGLETAVVLLRYVIVAVPICLCLVAVAADHLWSWTAGKLGNGLLRRVVPAAVAVLLLLLLLAAGPLPATYARPNNFSNHSAFQGHYAPLTWERSDARHPWPAYSIEAGNVPEFYHWLGRQSAVRPIIEYPFDICNYNNLLYYYQHFHRKSVLAGYCGKPELLSYGTERQLEEGVHVGMLAADQILARVSEPRKLLFSNMVDLTDEAAIRASGADYIVMHRSVMALEIEPGGYGSVAVRYGSVRHLAQALRDTCGPPVFNSEGIIVFRLPPSTGAGRGSRP